MLPLLLSPSGDSSVLLISSLGRESSHEPEFSLDSSVKEKGRKLNAIKDRTLI